MKNELIKIRPDILKAIKNNQPVVALESTLISHGLPYPQNLEVAKKSILAIEDSGSLAATIAIINGSIKIGITEEELNILAKKGTYVEKVSRHNLITTISKSINGATTVASTIMIANKVGIKYFATGGIGGVHIGSENTFDISSDLIELSKCSLNVICSGAKSILDLDKTYELLETLGITRIGYKTNYMSGFWYQKTNKPVDYNVNNIIELKDIINKKNKLGISGSLLIFNSLSKKQAIDKKLTEKWINLSILNANKNKITGKDLTPYLIASINKLSKGKTLKANMSLIINNARLAGKIAAS